MENGFKNKQKSINLSLIGGIVAIAAGAAGAIIALCAAGSAKNAGLLAVGVGFTSLFFALAIYFAVLGGIKGSRNSLAVAVCSLALAVVLLLIVLNVNYVAVLITSFALVALAFLGIFIIFSGKLTLFFDNESEDFVDYKTRKKLKDEQESKKPEEELPEIKSFKD